ncbi:MAG: class I SAM-dependent methyltransferase [Solirubrobacterales bacterium]
MAKDEGSGAISPTAHYTGETWVRNGLSHPRLATWQGRFFHRTMALPNALSRMLGGPSLEGALLARHRIIDACLDDLIGAGVSQVIEVACGMSPRGWRFAERYGDKLAYIEADLPAMAERKREALAEMGSLGVYHPVTAIDVLRESGMESLELMVETMDPDAGLAIITEGLLTYLDDETVEALWGRLARMLRPFPKGVYLADLRYARPARGASERAFDALLGTFVRGRVHPYRGDEASAKATLLEAGFAQAQLHRGDEHPAAGEAGKDPAAAAICVIEARV